jgi:hypothetical protein
MNPGSASSVARSAGPQGGAGDDEGLFTAILAVVAIAGFTQIATAQYMYLDSNGNGVHDAGDVMQGTGVGTTVDGLATNANRDGSPHITLRTVSEPEHPRLSVPPDGGVRSQPQLINRTAFPSSREIINRCGGSIPGGSRAARRGGLYQWHDAIGEHRQVENAIRMFTSW